MKSVLMSGKYNVIISNKVNCCHFPLQRSLAHRFSNIIAVPDSLKPDIDYQHAQLLPHGNPIPDWATPEWPKLLRMHAPKLTVKPEGCGSVRP